MSNSLRNYCGLVAIAALTLGHVSAVAHADESVGVSAVPDTFSPPPRPVKPPPAQPPLQPSKPSPAPVRPMAMRPHWQSYNFPTPNGGLLVFEITPSGNPACASYDGRNCLWGRAPSDIDFSRVRPLTCGADHRAAWGVTGYEDRGHWCSLARSMRRQG
jgi:hypothetical protein